MTDEPNFLDLPARAGKPRSRGLTHVLDKGMSIQALDALLDQAAAYIDVLKLGWGLGYLDKDLRSRALLCRQANVSLCLGGTLVEVAAYQRRIGDLAIWARAAGIEALEVSNGLQAMSVTDKQRLVRELSQDFVVFSETGAKDQEAEVSALDWVEEMEGDLAAGAAHVIAEGRESGTVGLYRPDGSPRTDLIDAIVARVPLGRMIFEAPNKAQQTWFIQRYGADVGLGNVPSEEPLALETLRLGLRADTAVVTTPRVGVSS